MTAAKNLVLKPAPMHASRPIEGDKRQYAPYVLEWQCTDCRENHVKDFRDDYLSYPPFGVAQQCTLWCKVCNAEFLVDLKLSLVLELVEP